MKSNDISRRNFLKTSLATGMAGNLNTLFRNTGLSTASAPAGKLSFSCMVTIEDWAVSAGTWGEVGAYYVLLRLRDSGFKRVYWRSSGCGQASYPSKVASPI